MRQHIILAKIAGEAAGAIESKFAYWSNAREVEDCSETRLHRISSEIDRFVVDLESNAELPPVLFYCQYLDMWSMGDLLDRLSTWGIGKKLARAWSDQSDLRCYSLPDDGRLARSLRLLASGKTPHRRIGQEERLFARVLYEAVLVYESLYSHAVIVIIRRILGMTLSDKEISSSLIGTPLWLREKTS